MILRLLNLNFKNLFFDQASTTERLMEKYICDVCGYVYDPEAGDPDNDVQAGTSFADVPDSWACPLCGAGKSDFSVEE